MCGFCGIIDKNSLCDICRKRINKYEIAKINDYTNDNSFFFNKHAYVLKYNDEIRKKILDYKFDNKAYLYKTFARVILNNQKIRNFINSYEIIIPVPIHKKRYIERGYNQSELLSRELAVKLKTIKLQTKVLKKVKNNMAQSTLNKSDRALNVQNAYVVTNSKIIFNKKILLLDDIYTTGNTANECAKVLISNGAKEIGVITIAKG